MVSNLSHKTFNKDTSIIPQELIREVIYEKPYYYKDYRKVLNNEKTLEEIMGSSSLQSGIISALLIHFGFLLKKEYRVLGSEAGLHLNTNDNLSLDLAFYKKADLSPQKFDNHYLVDVPVSVIEVDVSIDLLSPQDQDYVFQKTQRLLDFGVEQVVWILTKSRKIMIAKPNETWTVDNWDKEFSFFNQKLILENFLKEEGIIV
ncbi:MAG: Uma2 family endonuclease [Saprospiraceae bacterium]